MSSTDYALKIIYELMKDPFKSAESQRRIELMFKIIEHKSYPPVIIKGEGKG